MTRYAWFEGDIHNHEDGSVPIEEHIEKVRQAGYDFICLQYKDMEDPRRIPDPNGVSREDLLVIPGAEQAFKSSRGLWVHFGFLPFDIPMPDTITDYFNIEQGLKEAERRHPGCLKILHHPSSGRSTMEDNRIAHDFGVRYFELNARRERIQEMVDLWDSCLSSDMFLMATLSTDAHGLAGIRRCGYVLAHASSLERDSILGALQSGDFVAVEEGCKVRPEIAGASGRKGSYEVAVEGAVEIAFIGSDGKVLDRTKGSRARYRIRGNEGYVRAEAKDGEGLRLFAQPYVVPR